MSNAPRLAPLYDPSYEHDACGVGLVVDIEGRPSRSIVERALAGLVNLTHRGGIGADARTGDGAGLLTQIPLPLFQREARNLGQPEPDRGNFAVAMTFLPPSDPATARGWLEDAMAERGLPVLGWRAVPTEQGVLGDVARSTLPEIGQLLIGRPEGVSDDAFERELFLGRRAAERRAAAAGATEADFFVVSCSARTLIYKGFCLPEDLAAFYPDLRDPAYESAIALFHQRYSTNTLPTWAMAQPFRYLAHNGEINTIGGNRRWMDARSPLLDLGGNGPAELAPVVSWGGSDSLSLDNVVELLAHADRSVPHALMTLIPESWEDRSDLSPALRAFYDYHAGLIEPWDGPAALGFSDGIVAGAALDRNGLRPLRYAITSDGLLIAGSEAGTVAVAPAEVVEKGRLGPGQMIAVDTARGMVLRNDDLKREIAADAPYEAWLAATRVAIAPFAPSGRREPMAETPTPVRKVTDPAIVARQQAFGYTAEELRLIVQPMAGEGKEPTWSMGDDAPLAVLSERPRPLHAYLRQRFAQVTNPAIDSLRERSVMALDSIVGRRTNLLAEEPPTTRLAHLPSVALNPAQLAALEQLGGDLKTVRISVCFPVPQSEADPGAALRAAVARLISDTERAVRDGAAVLILSDMGVDSGHTAIPMLLAVGAVHHTMIAQGIRCLADIVAEAGEVNDVHAFACLIGYGASAVVPYLALNAAAALAGTRGHETLTVEDLHLNYLHSLEKGFLKVAAKMGISTAMGYRGAQVFETIGLAPEVIDCAFRGTPARLAGIGFAEIESDLLRRHHEAFAAASPAAKLPDLGFIRYRKEGEPHAYEPPMVKALQAAVTTGDRDLYDAYREHVAAHPLTTVRNLLQVSPLGDPVPLSDVEPAEAIVRRFVVTAMSLGALSPEAYRTLAVAMNRLGARSNSGEGGEDPAWYDEARLGPDVPHSKVKQVASGRFGVTARYLAHAEELEIKIAQGSKPGEGGQLPGHKVTPFIAHVRHAVPGLPLISPPPHHDIYSIEDLAQLIFDLRQINPHAKIGVKLVAEAGVGTVAAGVAKAKADYILVSGHSGGTGASPLASIKHAGCPWELGLAETQQTLVRNGLRSRVRLRTDGGIKTADDVIVAALLGAEEFGFGTSVLIAIGCDMARQCHLNTCPTGIATQREDLRAKFTGKPEQVINYFMFLAEAIREALAELGARSLEEIVGRSDLLAPRPLSGRAGMLDVSALCAEPAAEALRRNTGQPPADAATLDDRLLADIEPALAEGRWIRLNAAVQTSDRTIGAKISHAVISHDGPAVNPGAITLHLSGSAGQSFGAFLVDGVSLLLEGEANDYVGKGMSGGEIAIRPPAAAPFTTPQTIAGNTILYGATGGSLFLAGAAGERFAVRNSGAAAVVEGTGDHGCEYMTGGEVVVLGPTGRNFGAGMTNGVAYVYDPDGHFPDRINGESVLLESLRPENDDSGIRSLIERHVDLTGSAWARTILDRWEYERARFWVVIPRAAVTARAEQAAEASVAAGVAD